MKQRSLRTSVTDRAVNEDVADRSSDHGEARVKNANKEDAKENGQRAIGDGK